MTLLMVVNSQDEKEAKSVVYNKKQNVELEIAIKRSGNKISVSINSSKPYTIRFVISKTSKSTDDELKVEGNDSIVTPQKR